MQGRFVGVVLAFVVAACSPSPAPSPTAPVTQPTTSVTILAAMASPSAKSTATPVPASLAASTQPPAASPTPMPSDLAALLANPSNALYMAALPANHETVVSQDAAIAAVRSTYNVADGELVYVAHGYHGEPAWLIIIKVPDMAPIPVGPGCPSPAGSCHQVWAVNDYVVSFISDQTGKEIPGGFVTMKEVFPSP